MKKETNLEKAFNLFTGEDEMRPVFSNPFEYNGKVCATDAHALIFTDKSNIDFEFSNSHKAPNIEAVLPKTINGTVMHIEIALFESLKVEDEMEEYGDELECEECYGDGEVTWEYGSHEKKDDCPVCDGHGVLGERKKRPTGNKTFNNSIVKIGEAYFYIKLFYKIIEVQKLLGGEISLISEYGKFKAHVFEVGNCKVLLMPFVKSTNDEFDSVIEIL